MIGKMVMQYLILEEIGRGSMGIVFKAEDTVAGRLVALKIVAEKLVNDPQMLRRFEREGAAASALRHPNICTVYESGEWQGRPYLALELLSGQTLDHHLAAGPLSAATLLDIAIGVTSALEATHAIGVIHRDIKPANLFLTDAGAVKVLDFGLAKEKLPPAPVRDDCPTTTFITRPGMLLGTLAYMSPEQIRCEPLDGRSDLYSLGIVLHELATGQLPVRGTGEALRLPVGLRPIVTRLIEMDPARRYQTAQEAREALEACATGQAFERCGIRPGLRD